MKRYKLFYFALTLALMVGCSSQSTTSNEKPEIETTEESTLSLSDEFDARKEDSYASLKVFVDQNIAEAGEELASRMVYTLLIRANEMIPSANEQYMYSQYTRDIKAAIEEAMPEDLEPSQQSTFLHEKKQELMKNLPEGEAKNILLFYLSGGFGLYSPEGTYNFVLDYPEFLAQYGDYVDDATKAYLSLSAEEVASPTFSGDILIVDADTLGERAISYELYLASYEDSLYRKEVRTSLNNTIAKLSYPSTIDGLLDNNGRASADLLVVYERLSNREDCPSLQVVGEMALQYIAQQPDGILVDGYDSSSLSSYATEIISAATKIADTSYGTI